MPACRLFTEKERAHSLKYCTRVSQDAAERHTSQVLSKLHVWIITGQYIAKDMNQYCFITLPIEIAKQSLLFSCQECASLDYDASSLTGVK